MSDEVYYYTEYRKQGEYWICLGSGDAYHTGEKTTKMLGNSYRAEEWEDGTRLIYRREKDRSLDRESFRVVGKKK